MPDASLSVVLAMPDGYGRIRRTLEHLRAQTVRERIEVVVVTDGDPHVPAAALEGFAAHRIVRVHELRSRAAANAVGYRHASAEVVVFAEDHCFPEASWAQHLLRRHGEPWAAVGPAVRNANPETIVSWCDLLLNYGPWLADGAGPAAALPGHNTSYKRAALAGYGDALADRLEVEPEMHAEMDRCGRGLFFEPAARVAHVNMSRLLPWLACAYFGGRIYAAARARSWSASRKLAYAAAWPAIALVRLVRMLSQWPGSGAVPPRRRILPTLLAGLVADAAGQGAGYLAGAGGAARAMPRFEFQRVAHVRAAERTLLESVP
jgi:glycosyltransferase involved in cell wall biosynthesis